MLLPHGCRPHSKLLESFLSKLNLMLLPPKQGLSSVSFLNMVLSHRWAPSGPVPLTPPLPWWGGILDRTRVLGSGWILLDSGWVLSFPVR